MVGYYIGCNEKQLKLNAGPPAGSAELAAAAAASELTPPWTKSADVCKIIIEVRIYLAGDFLNFSAQFGSNLRLEIELESADVD